MLLDTCILINLLRGRSSAGEFIKDLPVPPSISAVTATELIAGVRGAKEREAIDRLLAAYDVKSIDTKTAVLAGEYVRQYGPSHSTDPIDALIAATAKRFAIPLATLNVKHFPMFDDLARAY